MSRKEGRDEWAQELGHKLQLQLHKRKGSAELESSEESRVRSIHITISANNEIYDGNEWQLATGNGGGVIRSKSLGT